MSFQGAKVTVLVSALSGLGITACAGDRLNDTSAALADSLELRNGQTVADLVGTTADGLQLFRISVRENAENLRIWMSGGTGDADLYVRYGAAPDADNWDCRPFDHGNEEACDIEAPAAGDWYVGIEAYDDFDGLSLSGEYQTVMTNGSSIADLSGESGEFQYFRIHVPQGASGLVASISSDMAAGDADIFARFGERPTADNWDCRPFSVGNNETCRFDEPEVGDWYIGVRAFTSYSDVIVRARYAEPAGRRNPIVINGDAGELAMFTIDVPEGASDLSVSISGGSGDADLFVRYGAEPDELSYDCRPYLHGNEESCMFADPEAGRWFVGVLAYDGYQDVELTIDYDVELSNGSVLRDLLATTDSFEVYRVEVPEGAEALTIEMSGGDGDADLYVRYGQEPDLATYDCRPYDKGNDEACAFDDPTPGIWYVAISGYEAYSGTKLRVDFIEELINGSGVVGLTESDSHFRVYRIDLAEHVVDLEFDMTGGTGDADMYVRFGAAPTPSEYDCRPFSSGNEESCSFDAAEAGPWYVGIRDFSAYADVELSVNHEYELANGEAVDSLAGYTDLGALFQFIRIEVPEGATKLRIEMSGGTGDADLYVLRGDRPDEDTYDCRPFVHGNVESCEFDAPADGYWYVGVTAFEDFGAVTVSASYTEPAMF